MNVELDSQYLIDVYSENLFLAYKQLLMKEAIIRQLRDEITKLKGNSKNE